MPTEGDKNWQNLAYVVYGWPQGQCINSKFIGIVKSSEKVQCTKSCDENIECHSSTFNPNLNVCLMYSECESIDSVQCTNCLTYKKALSIGECYNPGFCKVRWNMIVAVRYFGNPNK